MPDDPGRAGGKASIGKWPQMEIIISKEVWLHRYHNKSAVYRLISKPYPVNGK